MSDEIEPVRRETLRASDHDRNRVVTMLSDALGLGQITFGEYEERSHRAVEARTFADLDRLVVDLPASHTATPSPTYAMPHQPTGNVPRLGDTKVAVMTETKVRGPIGVGAEHTAFSFWGNVCLDLREATFLVRDVTINAYSLMGGIDIILPPNAVVHVDGVGVMGSFDHKNPRAGTGDGPRITVKGFAFWAGVCVQQK